MNRIITCFLFAVVFTSCSKSLPRDLELFSGIVLIRVAGDDYAIINRERMLLVEGRILALGVFDNLVIGERSAENNSFFVLKGDGLVEYFHTREELLKAHPVVPLGFDFLRPTFFRQDFYRNVP